MFKIRVDGTENKKIEDAGINSEYADLFVCSDNGKPKLRAHWYENEGKQYRYKDEFKILLKDLPGITKTNVYTKSKILPDGQYTFIVANVSCDDAKEGWFRTEPIDFRPEKNRYWQVRTGTWAIEGLSGKNIKTGKTFWIALETPFLMWPVTNATILPEDQVICQIGDQIAAIDLNTLQIGLITFGLSPVVSIEK